LAQSEDGIKAKTVVMHRVLRFRIVVRQKLVPAHALRRSVRLRKREAPEVCPESSEIEAGVRAPALLKTIKVEVSVDTVQDAVPLQRTVDRTLPPRRPRRALFPVLSNAVMEAIDQIRSGGHRLKPRLRSSNPHIERRAAVWFHAGKHDLALVQSGQRLSDPLRCVPDGSDAAAMSEVLAQV